MNAFAAGGVRERAHRDARRTRPRSRAAAPHRRQDRVGPRRLVLEAGRERVERDQAHGGIVRQRLERPLVHLGLDRRLTGHVERVVLRREVRQHLRSAGASSSAENSGRSRPAAPAASANSVHAPPDCSAAATPVVRSLLHPSRAARAASNIVTGSSTRTTPLRAEPGVAQRRVAGQRPGVRHDRAARGLAATLGRADQHGLAGAAQRVESAADALDVAHRLDVARDDLRLRVGRPPTRTCPRARARPRCRRRG